MDALTMTDDLETVSIALLERQITSYAGGLAAAQARWLLWIAAYDEREGWQLWKPNLVPTG